MSEHVTPEKIFQLGLGLELEIFTTLAGCSLDLEILRGELGLHTQSARDFFDVGPDTMVVGVT
jgi:hypothetical protein